MFQCWIESLVFGTTGQKENYITHRLRVHSLSTWKQLERWLFLTNS